MGIYDLVPNVFWIKSILDAVDEENVLVPKRRIVEDINNIVEIGLEAQVFNSYVLQERHVFDGIDDVPFVVGQKVKAISGYVGTNTIPNSGIKDMASWSFHNDILMADVRLTSS